jgi:hypothetical protein
MQAVLDNEIGLGQNSGIVRDSLVAMRVGTLWKQRANIGSSTCNSRRDISQKAGSGHHLDPPRLDPLSLDPLSLVKAIPWLRVIRLGTVTHDHNQAQNP